MNVELDRRTLDTGVSALLGWEKRKRREKTLFAAFCAALLAALAVPLFVAVPQAWAWSTPLALFALIAPVLLATRRWREPDTVRSLAAFDHALAADERVTTAWEFARRNDTTAVALLVLRQACERMNGANVRALFPRQWDKRSFLVLPLFALWLALHVFEARFGHEATTPAQPATLAQELREFARNLLHKARVEGLPRTEEAARELERLAQRGIDAKTGDKAFQHDVAGAQKKIAAHAGAMEQASSVAAMSRRELEDTKVELQTARDWLAAAGSASRPSEALLGRLTELRKHGEWRQQGTQELTREEARAFLDKLEKRVTAELDRRALLRTERQLRQFAQREPGRGGGRQPGPGGKAARDDAIEPLLEGRPSAPGEKPGTAAGNASPPPEYQVDSRSSVKGTIGDGSGSSVFLKGKPTAGRSVVAEDNVIAAYQRRAEAEINTEPIPGALKDAIRSYFLSLDDSK